jgi:hypothetical protein
VKVVGGFEISNFCIQHLVHFYTRFWSFSNFNRGPATLLRLECRRAASSRAHQPALAFAPHAGRGLLLPHAPRLEACPPAAARRTRAGRGGRATTASPSTRLRHRGGLPIKTEHRPALCVPHQAASRHCRPRAEARPFPRNRVDQPPSDCP